MKNRKLYYRADNPKVSRQLSCKESFAIANGWIPAEQLRPQDDRELEPYDKEEPKAEKGIEIIDIPEVADAPEEVAIPEVKKAPAKRAARKTTTKRTTKPKK